MKVLQISPKVLILPLFIHFTAVIKSKIYMAEFSGIYDGKLSSPSVMPSSTFNTLLAVCLIDPFNSHCDSGFEVIPCGRTYSRSMFLH